MGKGGFTKFVLQSVPKMGLLVAPGLGGSVIVEPLASTVVDGLINPPYKVVHVVESYKIKFRFGNIRPSRTRTYICAEHIYDGCRNWWFGQYSRTTCAQDGILQRIGRKRGS